MFCGNCGAENVNNAKFCKECGKPLMDSGNQGPDKTILPVNDINVNAGRINGNPSAPKGSESQAAKGNTLPKKLIIGVCAALAVLVAALITIICVVVNLSKTIKLDNYLVVETGGYDGYGTARAIIDWEAIEEKYGSKVSFTNAAQNEAGGLLSI